MLVLKNIEVFKAPRAIYRLGSPRVYYMVVGFSPGGYPEFYLSYSFQ